MQSAHLQLLDDLRSELQMAPTRALVALDGLRSGQSMREPDWFNVPQNFRDANEVAFSELKAVFTVLGDIELWDQEAEKIGSLVKEGSVNRMTHNKMMKAAALCARADEHESAVRLLLNAQVEWAKEVGRKDSDGRKTPTKDPAKLVRQRSTPAHMRSEETYQAHRELAIKLIEGDKIIEKGLVQPWPGTLLLLMREDDRIVKEAVSYTHLTLPTKRIV